MELETGEKDKKESSHSARPASPGSPARCPICLAPPDKRACTNACLHAFCFSCLKEWSKVKAECPLCKTPFRSILHNIRGDNDYDEEEVQTESVDPGSTLHDVIRLGFTRSVEDLIHNMSTFRQQMRSRAEAVKAAMIASTNVDIIRRRRLRYRHGHRASSVNNNKRKRDVSASFYQSNPAQLHRLVPWLRRELLVLFGANNMTMVRKLRELILSCITTCGIMSQQFYEEIEPYFGERTDHFIHEFQMFARSVHDIGTYDTNVNYQSEMLSPPEAPYSLLSDHFLGFSEPPLASVSSRVRSRFLRSNHVRERKRRKLQQKQKLRKSTVATEVIEISSDSENDTTDDKQTRVENKKSSSDDEVMFVGYTKPLRQRTPDAFVSLSSTDDNEEMPGTSGLSSHAQVISDGSPSSLYSSSSDLEPQIKSVVIPVSNSSVKLCKIKSRRRSKNDALSQRFMQHNIRKDFSSSSDSDAEPREMFHRQKYSKKHRKR